jgi:hypothetical protein
MTEVQGLGALSRALGSLSRPFNNKGIRHGKTGKTPSLRGAQRRSNPEYDVCVCDRLAQKSET